MVDKNKMDLLKDEFINAKSEKERESVREKMRQMCDDDAVSVATLAVEQIKETHTEIDAYLIRKQMEDILPCISLAYIAETYFKKSRQWLYQRVNGLLVNGKPARFTPEEIETLNFALQDMGKRLATTRIS